MQTDRTVRPATLDEVGPAAGVADVVVIGLGAAGACAGYEAAAAGADVLVLERASGGGGTSAMSGGEIYLGAGTSVQQACGFDDTAEAMTAFLRAALGPDADEDKIAVYVAGSVAHFEWLAARGVEFRPSLYDDLSWMPPTEDGLMWLGERSWPFTTVAEPAPRGHRPATGHFGGWLLMEKLLAAATAAGVRTAVDTTAERLVVDGDGRVVGVLARQYGQRRAYLGRRGVVLTTGGFVDDDAMLAQHAPQLLGMDKISCGNEDGSGIRMGQAVGAAVRHMDAGQVGFHAVPALMARGMVVNRYGQRFVNEDTYPGRVGQAALFRQGMGCWVVLDEQAFEQVPTQDLWGVVPHHVAETLAELEELTGLPPGALEGTVATYNHHAERGWDPYFHKDPRWLRPLQPPYAAVDPRRTFRGPNDSAVGPGAAVFTLGGLSTDVDGRVLDLDGTAVPGLFAAGRSTSGLCAWGYISGTSLGDGTFFGRRAGVAAAAEPGGLTDRDFTAARAAAPA